ncbi:MAG: aminoacyl-tRNA hydrolase [Candidatus Harrisonbacteria bacterium]|nr:aminoacyl-tRNA hydrolase [Candidatus Harrisonbacteria bacterium]MBI2406467.1 aminoacyl-tRNA hydrolase [Candidatus Harrisonbacteria bacterium]MBI2604368.1 aminoacyl-tRNA hydrolase [Candidatus Harrisonbacteria bacterium]MBI3114397.1 aminoacyl-tRNA hydrolase [Candidatus Harrisonbacteria bacterium]
MLFKLIIGLGNNDAEYRNTYHNVGHLFVDAARETHPEYHAEKNDGYMNEAGASVKKIMREYNARPEETLLVHDDSDLILGTYKFSVARGSAGHKGVKSVFDTVKSNAFPRLRIGIRPQPRTKDAPRKKAEEFVLKTISAANKKILTDVFAKAMRALT